MQLMKLPNFETFVNDSSPINDQNLKILIFRILTPLPLTPRTWNLDSRLTSDHFDSNFRVPWSICN